MAATLPYPNLYENNNLAPSPPIDPTTTPILDPYTRGYMAQGIQQGQLWDIVTPQGYEAEAQRRTGLLREAIVPAAEQTIARGLEDVRSTMQRGGKLSSSAAIKQQMRTSELYGAQVAGTMAQGTLGIYEQLGTERGAELNRMLASGTTETGAIQQMYQTRAGLASQERITQIQENTRAQIAQIQASTELSAQEKQYQIAQLQATAQKETATITGTLGLTGTKYTADIQRQIADVQTQMQRQITVIEADTTLTVEDKRAAIAKLQFAAQEKITNIQAAAQTGVAEIGLKGTVYSADTQQRIAVIQTETQRDIARIEADTTLSVEDKRTAVAQLQFASQERIANIQATAQVETAGIGLKGVIYSADTQRQIEGIKTASQEKIALMQTETARKIAEIEADTTLTVEEKRDAVNRLQIQSDKDIATAQMQSAESITNIQSKTTIEATRLTIVTEERIASIQTSTTLSVADKEAQTATLRMNNELTIARESITSATTINDANIARDKAIAEMNNLSNTAIANIQKDTTLSAKDKEVAIANINAQTQLSISSADNTSREKINALQVEAQITATGMTVAGQAQVSNIQTQTARDIANIEANTALSAQEKQVQIANINAKASKEIADVQKQAQITVASTQALAQMTSATTAAEASKAISVLQTASNETINTARNTAEKDIANINSRTDLSVADKEYARTQIINTSNEAIATAKYASDNAIAELDNNNRLSLADKEYSKTQLITTSNETISAAEQATAILQIQGTKDVATINKQTAIAVEKLQISGAAAIARINSYTTLSVADKQAATAKLSIENELAIANVNNTSKEKIALDEIQGSKDIAEINTKSAELITKAKNRSDQAIAIVEANNRLKLSDKELLKTKEITRSNEAIADLEVQTAIAQFASAETIADIQATSDEKVARINRGTANSVARINQTTTLSAMDKEKEITILNNQNAKALANIDSRTQLGIADKRIIEAKTVADIQTKSVEKINLINARKDMNINALQLRNDLTLAEKEAERTRIITKSNEDIAATNNLSAETIANAQIAGQKDIADLSSTTQKYISDNEITGATTVANIQTLSNEKVAVLNKLRDEALAKVNAKTALSLSDKETERTKINNQTDKDIADIQTASAETIAWKQAGVAMALGRISDATQRYIANAGLTEQVREFDITTLAEKAKDMNTYQRVNPFTKAVETVSEPWAVTIAREQMAQELSIINKTEMGKDPDTGLDVPRWQVELKARTKETLVEYVDENGVKKSVPVAYAIAQDQFDNIITTTDMNNDANWEMLGRQIDAAVQSDILDAQTTRTIAANALAQRAKESTDVVEQQEYQNMVDLITNPAVIAYMEKNPAKEIMGEGIIELLKASFTGEGIKMTPEQFMGKIDEANAWSSYKGVDSSEKWAIWARDNPKEAQIIKDTYSERVSPNLPPWIQAYGTTTEEQKTQLTRLEEVKAAGIKSGYTAPTGYYERIKEFIGQGYSFANAEIRAAKEFGTVTEATTTQTTQITPFVETNPNLEVTMT